MHGSGPVLVLGATGAQGRAVADALLEGGIPVRALVRDVSTAAAQGLEARGVQIVQGDFGDAASLACAATGAVGLFSVQLPPMPNDLGSELRTGKLLVDAAREAGIAQFVHSSVARAGDEEDFAGWSDGRWWRDYWTSKSGVNDLVRQAGFAHWTILKPAFMMDNFIPPKVARMFPALARGVIETAMTAGSRLDLIAASDVGRFAAAAFADPLRFDRQRIDLASESLTMDEVAGVISKATGTAVIARHLLPDEALAAGLHAGLVESQEWASVEGYKVDIAKARSHGIGLMSFADWADRHGASFDIAPA